MGRDLILASLILLSLGCSSPVVEPRDEAEERCAWHPHGLPEDPFTSDVCSAWPDGDWGACCIDHDIDYWCGGSSERRASADERLKNANSRRAREQLSSQARTFGWETQSSRKAPSSRRRAETSPEARTVAVGLLF